MWLVIFFIAFLHIAALPSKVQGESYPSQVAQQSLRIPIAQFFRDLVGRRTILNKIIKDFIIILPTFIQKSTKC